jgi:hypothetical protein
MLQDNQLLVVKYPQQAQREGGREGGREGERERERERREREAVEVVEVVLETTEQILLLHQNHNVLCIYI